MRIGSRSCDRWRRAKVAACYRDDNAAARQSLNCPVKRSDWRGDETGTPLSMQLDVDDLQEFYGTPLGQTVRRLLTHRIRARWRGLHSSTLIGLGYSSPYLGAFRGEALRLGALTPDSLGAVAWPRNAPSHSVL